MPKILLNHARQKNAPKRSGGHKIELNKAVSFSDGKEPHLRPTNFTKQPMSTSVSTADGSRQN